MGRDSGQRAASKWFDRQTGEPETDQAPAEGSDDLQAVAEAAGAVAVAEGRLRQTVDAARAQGRSWRQIGLVLGMSRQAAREGFGEQSSAKGKASRARRVMGQETAVLDRLAQNQAQTGVVKHFPDAGKAERGQAKKVRRSR